MSDAIDQQIRSNEHSYFAVGFNDANPCKKNESSDQKTDIARLKVAFILLPEFALFAFAGFIDALRLAGDDGDKSRQRDCHWTVIGPNENPVRSSSGIEITPWSRFPDSAAFDYLVVIGGRVAPKASIHSEIGLYISKVAALNKPVIGICTASFVLARAGIMNETKCCVHWFHRDEFSREFPNISVDSDTMFIEHNNCITCPGGRSAVDVALHIIKKHFSSATARKVMSAMVIEKMRGGQSPQPHAESAWYGELTDPVVKRAIMLMDQSITKPLDILDILRHLNLNRNTFYRLFNAATQVSPARLFRAMRLAHGHWSLLKTELPISSIAHHYGFSDASHFARVHNEYYGLTPSEVRLKSRTNEGLRIEESNIDQSNLEKIIQRILYGGLYIYSEKGLAEIS